jgi:[ribosomal protein S5]-alanine N-acetyltransferase
MNKEVSIDPIIFNGSRIVLNPVSLEGLNDFHEYSTCKELYNHFEFSRFKNISESQVYLTKLIERSKSNKQQFWFIKEIETKKVIGSFGVHSLNSYRGSVEIGYGLSPHYWGNGYFKEAADIIIDHVFNNLHLHRIVAKTSVLNKSSITGLKRLKFESEGIMKDYYRKYNGQWYDAILMARIN